MSDLTLQWTVFRPVLFCTFFFCERIGYKFEDAMAVTDLEHVSDGQ